MHELISYALSGLVENSTIYLSAQYFQLFSALRPLFVVPENATSARLNANYNACDAARLIIRNANSIPLAQVRPVFTAALHLKNDFLKSGSVFRVLLLLSKTNGVALYPLMDRLLPAFAHALDPKNTEGVSNEIRGELTHLLELINREKPVKKQAAGLGAFLPSA